MIGGVDHAQAFEAVHLQFRIDHGHRIVDAHLAGADRVIDGVDALRAARCGCRRRSATPSVNMSYFCNARSAGVSSSRRVILNPATMVSRSSASPKKFGSISGRRHRIGAAERRRCRGSSAAAGRRGRRSRCPSGACGRDRRPCAMQKCNWISGTSRSGRVFRKPPHSAKFDVIGPRRSRRYWPMPEHPRQRLQRQAGEIRLVGHVAEHEIRMVLQVLSDAGQMMHAAMPCLPSAAASPTPDSISSCGVWNAPEETITSRRARICFSLLALAVFDADRALALEQDAGGVGAGLDAQIGAAAHDADGCSRAPRSSVRRSSASPDRCRGLPAPRR